MWKDTPEWTQGAQPNQGGRVSTAHDPLVCGLAEPNERPLCPGCAHAWDNPSERAEVEAEQAMPAVTRRSGGPKMTVYYQMIEQATPRAILVRVTDGFRVWVPLSLVDEHPKYCQPGAVDGSITVPEWLARSRGLK